MGRIGENEIDAVCRHLAHDPMQSPCMMQLMKQF
jgi:hypothetical protein